MIQGTGKTSDGVPITQRHFLATSPSGKQVVFSFLIEPKFDEKPADPPAGQAPQPYLGAADLEMVTTMEFLAPAQTADKEGKAPSNSVKR